MKKRGGGDSIFSMLWNRNYYLRFLFQFRFLLLKSSGSGSCFWKSYGSGSYIILTPYSTKDFLHFFLSHFKSRYRNRNRNNNFSKFGTGTGKITGTGTVINSYGSTTLVLYQQRATQFFIQITGRGAKTWVIHANSNNTTALRHPEQNSLVRSRWRVLEAYFYPSRIIQLFTQKVKEPPDRGSGSVTLVCWRLGKKLTNACECRSDELSLVGERKRLLCVLEKNNTSILNQCKAVFRIRIHFFRIRIQR
jgi:hypothetical protein